MTVNKGGGSEELGHFNIMEDGWHLACEAKGPMLAELQSVIFGSSAATLPEFYIPSLYMDVNHKYSLGLPA